MSTNASLRYKANDDSFIGETCVPVEKGDNFEDVVERMFVLMRQYRTEEIPLVPMTITLTLEETDG
jgi:hypothetical protein